MIITFWGVRGSIPVAGPHTLRYGGNTSCVSVEQDDAVLVLDAGTGMRALGASLVGSGKETFLLLSHLHADHLAGFPFFQPLYERGSTVHLLDYVNGVRAWSALQLFDGVHYPLYPEDLACRHVRVREDTLGYLHRHGFQVARIAANHPGGAYGYRLTGDRHTFVYLPDNELHPPDGAVTPFEAFVAFCRGADVLCHDAQYVAQDFPAKRGWGHSQIREACDLAVAARVRHLVLFHHDPDRDDAALGALEEEARRRLHPHGIRCTAAYEGLRLAL